MLLLPSGPVPLLLPDQCRTTRREYERAWFRQAHMEHRKEWAWIEATNPRHIRSGATIALPATVEPSKHIITVSRELRHMPPSLLDTVICCDALALLRALPPNCVDMIFIDPPYNRTNLDFEEEIDWQSFWSEARRVLRHLKSPVLSFSQQPFTTDLINSNRSGFRYEIVLEKTMPTGFLDANRRPMRCHENLLIFADAMPDYYPEFEPAEVKRGSTHNRRKVGVSTPHYGKNASPYAWYDEGKRYPRDVWRFAQRESAYGNTKTLHPTQKPLQAVEKAIRLFSIKDDVIVDCFCGSGTTLVAARKLDRRFIGCDKSPEYVTVTRERLQNTDPFQPTVHSNGMTQQSLFALAGVEVESK